MSQVCEYEIHARGSHGAVLALYSAIRNYDQEIDSISRVGADLAVIHFHGSCMNDPDWGCMEAEDGQTEQPADALNRLTLKAKSAILKLEIQVFADDGEGMRRFDSYRYGNQMKHGYSRQEFDY